ncbi:unnamed protein product [Protopolystoma xenopodis]|uniref:Uncharacterized protein n=1 Tax=Protopolystoma xenopodis TaxID=117903 RepID=A0A448WJR4_9PLAT|nr:unnamed protein product [Protopolystoma xenopodis]
MKGSSGNSNNTSRQLNCAHQTSRREVVLHASLADISSRIDSKQRLLAELQSRTVQLDRLRQHYQRQLEVLQAKIRETEAERDSVMANLDRVEHSEHEKLKRIRSDYEKRLQSMQVSRLIIKNY